MNSIPRCAVRGRSEKADRLALDESANRGVEAVPRHVEIPNKLAKKICRGLSVPEMESSDSLVRRESEVHGHYSNKRKARNPAS
jgi:hypothetical protein